MSILEFIIFLIIGSIVLPNIYNQVMDIINYEPEIVFNHGDLTNDICLGGICLNKCDNINGQEVKRTGNTALLNQDNTFQAVDCGDDKVIRDLRYSGVLCGEEGTEDCSAEHCCYAKLCENDLNSLDDVVDYEDHYSTPEAKIEKKRRDGNCPYQKTVKKDTPCSGGNPGESGGCTDIGECCEDKKCSTHWFSDANPEWGTQDACPHQSDTTTNTMLKYPDNTSCDTCNITECCYEQSDFCIVEANGEYNHLNTNVDSVNFPGGITSISFPNDINTSVDLTTNYFLSKDDISQTNIQNLLSFGSEGGTDDPSYGIKCENGFKYGMCSSSDGSVGEDTCKINDNNQRECEAAGCSFTLRDRPRVEYDECGGDTVSNIIKVGSCINTCTADYTLSDNGINYFTQTPIAAGNDRAGSYRVNPEFYSNKLNTDTDFPYSQGEISMNCYNHTGSGNTPKYKYTCEGGGKYFGVSELINCQTRCSDLHGDGERCGQGNIYDENKAGNISSYSNFRETGAGGCCKPTTCDTLSNGQHIQCLPNEKLFQTCTAKSGKEQYSDRCEAVNNFEDSTECLNVKTDNNLQACDYNDLGEASRDSCCVARTCTDFMNEYNELRNQPEVLDGNQPEVVDENNICLDGRTFNANRELTSAYLYQVSNDNNDAKLTRMDEYRSGSANYDIGCCSSLTCGDWLNNFNMQNTPADQKLSEASRLCGDGKFFVENMIAGNMGDSITENSPCCVGDSNITCSPTRELLNYSPQSGFTIPGYTISDATQFREKTFNMGTNSGGGGEYSIDADGVICSDGNTPSEGVKYECLINTSAGENVGSYYLSGCNDGATSDTGGTGATQSQGTHDVKLCSLPMHLENNIQVNGFSNDASNNVVNYNHFLGNQDQLSCNESTEKPIIDPCNENFGELTIKGCHYQDKPRDTDDNFYSDRHYKWDDHIIENNRESRGIPCENLYTETTDNHSTPDGAIVSGPPPGYRDELNSMVTHINDNIYPLTGSGSPSSDYAINKMKGNVSHFTCKCESGNNECHDYERQVRFKYIFANDTDYYNGNNGFIRNIDAHKRSLINENRTGTTDCSTYSTEDTCPEQVCFWERRAQETCSGSTECSEADMSGGMGEANCSSIGTCTYNAIGECQNPCGDYQNANECPQSCVWDSDVCKNPTQYSLNDILETGSTTVCGPGYYPYRDTRYDYCRPCDDLYKNNHPISAIAETFCDSGHMGDNPGIVTTLLDDQNYNESMNSNYESNSNDIDILKTVRVLNDGSTRANQDYGPYLSNLSGIDFTNNNYFMTGDNFTLGTRVCDPEPDGDTTCVPSVKLYGDYSQPAVEDSQFEKAKKWWTTYFNNNFENTDTDNSDISSAPAPVPSKANLTSRLSINSGSNPSVTFVQGDGSPIGNITDLKKEHYLYRNNLRINSSPIDTVCNNNTSEADYIPSFDSVITNEGECKECVNEMPPSDVRIQGGNAPLYGPDSDGAYIIRNINDTDFTPICDYTANMYDERYNEGNIIDFKSITTGQKASTSNNPCNAGFVYKGPNGELLYKCNQDNNGCEAGENVKYVKCVPPIKFITKFCENIPDESTCNKSFSTYLTENEDTRLTTNLKNLLAQEERDKINGIHYNGFCGWVDGKCKNIYDLGGNNHLSYRDSSHREIGRGPAIIDYQNTDVEDYSKHKTLYKQQSAMDILSPHITSYTTSGNYDYSNLYDSSQDIYYKHRSQDPRSTYSHQSVTGRLINADQTYTSSNNYDTHDNGVIKSYDDDVFKISNYGVGKNGVSVTGDDLTSLSIANALKEGYDLAYMSDTAALDLPSYFHITKWPLRPMRINPLNTKLNGQMTNRCHPILWDGPVDFFYENYNGSQGAGGSPKTTISSSCYIRKYDQPYDSVENMRAADGQALVPYSTAAGWGNQDGDFSIKATPLYYDKGRKVNGGTITNTAVYDNEDKKHNILNPGQNQDGLMYAYRYPSEDGAVDRLLPQRIRGTGSDSESIYSTFRNEDSGFADAAVFPLFDRVRGCFNDSLIYPDNPQTNSSLGLDDDNKKNEKEQCIFHYNDNNQITGSVGSSNHAQWNRAKDPQRYCINACLNNKECDLVRMTKGKPTQNDVRCELLKWNKLPGNINTKNTAIIDAIDEGRTITDEGTQSLTNPDNKLKSPNLGGHLINAKDEYDQSTREGVLNWFGRISDPQATEMDHVDIVSGDGKYRTEFYSQSDTDTWSDIRDWRLNHIYKTGTAGDNVNIKGRELWERASNDDEVWVSMNKIRAPQPNGKISEILNNINKHELPTDSSGNSTIQYIDVGSGDWRRSFNFFEHNTVNEENTYYANDGQTGHQGKYNEKTVIDSDDYKQCPPGTYVEMVEGRYRCSQVLNECASCKDIYDYHDKKGDFDGMTSDEKNKLLLSYSCTVDNSGNSGQFVYRYIGYSFIGKHPNWCQLTGGQEDCLSAVTDSNDNIFDSIGAIYKTDDSRATFSNQHNLMAKTPDGNIIDVEKCRCPKNKTVHTRRVSGGNRQQPIGICQ